MYDLPIPTGRVRFSETLIIIIDIVNNNNTGTKQGLFWLDCGDSLMIKSNLQSNVLINPAYNKEETNI